ncbi:MAG TPA: hypothetical protein VM867_11090 [Xanthobacteraceae bacterium]|nr:hypothetical protein [Xanthobacteraceae bacterium]
MDPATLAAIFINAQFAQVQHGARQKILQMRSEEATVLARAVVTISENAMPISNLPDGVGRKIDLSL